jgi:hypothetical protein
MPVGTRNTSSEQKAANFAAYKTKVAEKLQAKIAQRQRAAAGADELAELNGLLSRVSMSSSVDDLEDLLKDLKMGGRRRTRKQKHKGKKHPRKTRKTRRGGVQPPMSIQEKVKMLRAKLADLEKTGNASPAEIAAAEKEWSDAYTQMKRQMGPLERGYRADHGFAG